MSTQPERFVESQRRADLMRRFCRDHASACSDCVHGQYITYMARSICAQPGRSFPQCIHDDDLPEFEQREE